MKNFMFKFAPLITGVTVIILLIVVQLRFNLSYKNLSGFENVLESMVNFLSIVIGFYSAFYGMIISMTKTDFLKELSKSKYNHVLPKILIYSLLSSFAALITTVFLQILKNYPSTFAYLLYIFWGFLVGVFITYSIQTALLSIAMIFYSEKKPLDKASL
ncbi:hypothetical protein [Leuconostoc gelidum]|uniref:Uncharacterized protein n=1 Tax=Leuconostoc gelidum subsp. gelidum TaxID=1607839 RepID=A0AB35FXV5_LEUGE|nr:hypothetical protein [Leuconostoc gelidum]MBZ6015414.1 hypothetical protein [Leuconostoc gelidum subsp. gelidum]